MPKISFLTGPSGSGKTFVLDKLSNNVRKLDIDEIGHRYSDMWMVNPVKLSQWLTENALDKTKSDGSSDVVIAGTCDNLYDVIRIIIEYSKINKLELNLYYLWNRDVSDCEDFGHRILWLSRIYPSWQVIYNRFSKGFKFSQYDSLQSLISDGFARILDDRFGLFTYVKLDEKEDKTCFSEN